MANQSTQPTNQSRSSADTLCNQDQAIDKLRQAQSISAFLMTADELPHAMQDDVARASTVVWSLIGEAIEGLEKEPA